MFDLPTTLSEAESISPAPVTSEARSSWPNGAWPAEVRDGLSTVFDSKDRDSMGEYSKITIWNSWDFIQTECVEWTHAFKGQAHTKHRWFLSHFDLVFCVDAKELTSKGAWSSQGMADFPMWTRWGWATQLLFKQRYAAHLKLHVNKSNVLYLSTYIYIVIYIYNYIYIDTFKYVERKWRSMITGAAPSSPWVEHTKSWSSMTTGWFGAPLWLGKPIWIIISDSTPSATWRERTCGHFGISLCWHHRRRGTSNVLQTGIFPARQYKKRNTGNLGELIDQDCQEYKKKDENCYIFWSKIKNVTHFSRKPRQCFPPHPSLWRLIRQCQGTEASSFSWVFTFGRFVSAGMRQTEVGCWYLRLTKDIFRI